MCQLTPEQQNMLRVNLRDNIDRHFDDSELRSLCFDLGVDYDDLSGLSKADKARELVAYCERRGRTKDLISKNVVSYAPMFPGVHAQSHACPK